MGAGCAVKQAEVVSFLENPGYKFSTANSVVARAKAALAKAFAVPALAPVLA